MKENVSLVNSPVIFNEDGHTYTLNGQSLSGVTPIIAWLFPETYKGIPQSVLDTAKEYGRLIHKKIELADSMGIVDDPAVQEYMELKEQHGMKTLCNEYLVSDEHRIASSIDMITTDFDLCDIKTTSKVHIPNVTIQLSIYAWLFERMNPDMKVGKLYCIWLPKPQYGQPDIIELKRVSADVCMEIVAMYFGNALPIQARALLTGVGFEFERQRQSGDIPEVFEDMMDELINISQAMKQMQEREKAIKEVILSQMKKEGCDKWGNDLIQFSRKEAYERTSVDSAALKKNYPDIYKECIKTTKVAESVTYKVL